MKLKRIIYLIIGFIGLALGVVGAMVPLLPAFPFLMMAAIGFSRSSERLDNWFKSTKVYKDNLESYVTGKGMTKKAKMRVMITVTLFMLIGFVVMSLKGLITGCIILGFIWLFHILYFVFGVRSIEAV